jgi:hypothetical protein
MIPLIPMQQQLIDLRRQVEAQDNEIYDLKMQALKRDVVGEEFQKIRRIQAHFRLTFTEAKLLSLLESGRVIRYGFLLDQISEREVTRILLSVLKTKIEKKIKPLKISFKWSWGYFLEGELLQIIQQLMAGEHDGRTEAKTCAPQSLHVDGHGIVCGGSEISDGGR